MPAIAMVKCVRAVMPCAVLVILCIDVVHDRHTYLNVSIIEIVFRENEIAFQLSDPPPQVSRFMIQCQTLRYANLITEAEYSLIKKKLQKDYKVPSDILAHYEGRDGR